MTTSVLYVCHGNVCRSPFAELLGRHLFPSFRFGSAGVGALVGDPVDRHMAAELARRGVDHEGFAARMLTPALVEDADLIATMTMRQRDIVVREIPQAGWRVFVLGQLDRVVAALEPGVGADPAALGAALRAAHLAPQPGDDVMDPRGRGPAAAARTAERLEVHARSTLPKLARG